MLSLADTSLLQSRAYVNGEWWDGDGTFAVENPASGDVIAHVADLSSAQIASAIEAAHAAQKPWAARTAKDRARILGRLYELMMENQEDLARIITAEMGKPLSEARAEVAYGASYIEWFSEEAKRIYGETIPGHQADKRIITLKQPVGVVGSITPWNFPNAMIARKLAPTLAVGCTFVGRPSELTPLSALAVAVLADRAGVPAGVLNIVTSLDAATAGETVCAHPKVAKITFTGSTRVGKILMRQCADGIKRMSMELGGNAPFIVFDDADIDAAVEGAIVAKYRATGQTCVCANRIYVQSGVYDTFAEKLSERVAGMVVGSGFDDGVALGPLINSAALTKVRGHLADALARGASIATGGEAHPLGGNFFQPTVLTDVTSSMKVAVEETFGPIAPLFRFDTEEQAITLANDTEFGLAGYFYTRDLARAFRVAEALETGMVGVNTGLISTEVAPFGGVKQSGFGREGSRHGVEDYLEIKYVCLGGVA